MRERDTFASCSREKLQKMDQAIEARKETLNDGFSFPSLSVDHPEAAPFPETTVSEEYKGMTLPSMVHQAIALQPRRSRITAMQILEVMKEHGVEPTSQDPLNSVQTALNRRKTKNGEILHTGLGEWGLCEWYTESEIEKLKLVQDGANGRDKGRHIEAMKEGIAAAKARGAPYGKSPKITEQVWNLAVKLCTDEGRSIDYVHEKICELYGDGEDPITRNSLYNPRKKFAD